ncbi:MAG: type II secretion system protein [Candidatus Moranbacteria bacterium]|nr:type II secretion system protein [Candidatus Moranbacteria bacterium]
MPIKVFGCLPEEKAFTLIEVIVCLLLAGIMAALVGFGFVHVTEGYFFAKQNSETVQNEPLPIVKTKNMQH